MTQLGKELKKLRIDLGITLADMALSLGISPAFLSAVENNKKRVPDSFLANLAINYAYVQENREKFEVLINQARNEVVLKLDNPTYKETSIATALARKFSSLSEQDKDVLLNLLTNGERPNAS